MYQQPPRRIDHHLWIVLALISNILLASCSTTSPPEVPIPITVATHATPPANTPGNTPANTPGNTPTTTPAAIYLILMENHNWSDIKNNSSAPYINNTLLPLGSYAQQYYNPSGKHPSEPNYLWLEAGTNFGIFDDASPSVNHQNTTLHLVTLLNKANISWRSYQEGIDGTRCPLTNNGLYAPKHNPMVFFDDVTNTNDPKSPSCIAHIRPTTELNTDIQAGTVARYNFITPNLCNDMHDSCSPLNDPVKQGDTWLAQTLPTILNSQAYKNNGIIFIAWDEGEGGDGPIGMIILSPNAKGGGYSNTIHYTHSSTLRTLQEIFRVTPLLGDATNATDLSDLFKTFP